VKKVEQKSTVLIVVMLVVGLGIGAGIGYYAAPTKAGEIVEVTVEKNPLDGVTYRVGEISSTTSGLETLDPFLEDIVTPDLNAYLDKLGYDISVEILIDNADSQAAIHLEKVQSFHAMGVDLVVGGRWSSQAEGALSYVNENDMLLFSPSSTSPLLMFPDDNLYRMCPTDLVQAPAIAEMLWSWGIKACVVIQRGDAWADGIYNIFETEYPARGGEILERVRYAAEVTEFSSYLDITNNVIEEALDTYEREELTVLIISFQESAVMVLQASEYPTLMSIYWFGTDGTAFTQQHIDDAPDVSEHLKLFSTLAAPAASPKWQDLSDRYYDLVARYADFYTAADFDIEWVILNAVLEAGSMEAIDVIPLIMDISNNMFGYSGWCLLNEDGDRDIADYDIWGLGYEAGELKFVKYGVFSGASGTVSWDTSLVTPGTLPPEWGG
jgi:branched-chain amino acid transport system substrate-binding protein